MDFPPKCETSCPIVIETRWNIETYMAKKALATFLNEAQPEDIAEEMQEIASRYPDMSAEEVGMIGRILRSGMAHELDHLGTLIGRGEKLLGRLADGCEDGPLTFRVSKGDTAYTATVCASKNVPKRGKNEQPEPVHLTRMSKS